MEFGCSSHFSPMQIMSVQSRSDSVNSSLFDKREHIEKVHRTCNLLRKVQVLLIKASVPNSLFWWLWITEIFMFHISVSDVSCERFLWKWNMTDMIFTFAEG